MPKNDVSPALTAEANFYAAVVESSDDAIIEISLDAIIVKWNKGAEQIYGYTAKEAIGQPASLIIPKDRAGKISKSLAVTQKGESVANHETQRLHKNGKLIDVSLRMSPIWDASEKIIGTATIARDITESKKALFYARSVIEAGLDPMITISPEGKVTDVNEATVHITGVPREKLIGSDFMNYFTDKEEALQGNQQVFKEGFIREYPLTIRHISGALTDVLYNASVYKDDKGNVFGAIAAVRDITDRKKVDEQLHETSAYARSFVEASLDPLFIISPEGKITGVNHATEEITGVTREWLIDTDFFTYFTEPRKARDGYRQVLKKGEVRDYPLSIHHASGNITDVSFNASVYKDAIGKGHGIFAMARDVTDTKQLSLYSRSLIEASLDPLITISPEGKIMDVNEATIRIFGVSREKIIGTDFLNYFTEPQKAREGYEQIFKEGSIADYPLTIKSLDGKLTDVLYNASVYKDDKGNVLGVTGVARDNTKVKKATEEIASTSKEMEAFSGSASHDLRAPLRVIDGFAQMLVEDYADKLDDQGKEIVTNIRTSAAQMRKLIDDLLVFSRLGSQEIKKEYVAMGPLATEVCAELKQAVPKRNVACTIQKLSDSRGDKDTLRLVWTNLLSNAIKYTGPREQAVIEVGSKDEKESITYYVKDNGVGFDMKDVSKLFNVFERLHGVEEFEGTGMGLANVKRIVERHGGTVWAEGKFGEGATFYFSLPKINSAPKTGHLWRK